MQILCFQFTSLYKDYVKTYIMILLLFISLYPSLYCSMKLLSTEMMKFRNFIFQSYCTHDSSSFA